MRTVWLIQMGHAWLVSVRDGATMEEGNEIETRVAVSNTKKSAKKLAAELAERHDAVVMDC